MSLLKLITIMTLQIVAIGAPSFAGDNPFEEGTKTPVLTDSERSDLLKYAENSKTKLQDALKEAEGKTLGVRTGIYTSAILLIVQESFKDKRRAELLMRVALNQGLEMAVGLPKVTGGVIVGWDRMGTRAGTSNWESNEAVLRESIELAIKYYEDDRKAIESKSLINLPFVRFAQDRLEQAQSWLDTMMESGLVYGNQLTSLRHWLAVMLNEEQTSRAKYATETVLVDNTFKEMKQYPNDTKEMQRRIIVLRKTINQVLSGVEAQRNAEAQRLRDEAARAFSDKLKAEERAQRELQMLKRKERLDKLKTEHPEYAAYRYNDYFLKVHKLLVKCGFQYDWEKKYAEEIANLAVEGEIDFHAYLAAMEVLAMHSPSLTVAKEVLNDTLSLNTFVTVFNTLISAGYAKNNLGVADWAIEDSKLIAQKVFDLEVYTQLFKSLAYQRDSVLSLAKDVKNGVIELDVYLDALKETGSADTAYKVAKKAQELK